MPLWSATPTYSVLTPTFNRGHILHRVYESMQRQTIDGFEWIVVDDGSTDNTPELLATWQHEAKFPMTWCRYSNNRGRNAAVNTGVGLSQGRYTLIVDSDDTLFDDAIEKINYWRRKVGIDSDESISELRFRYINAHDGSIIGGPNPLTSNIASDDSPFVRYSKKDAYRLKLRFDMATVQKTKIQQDYPFTELDCNEHCAEDITHYKVRSIYDAVIVDTAIGSVYRQEGDGEIHLSQGYKSLKWSRGNYLRALAALNSDIEYLSVNPGHFLKYAQKITGLGLLIGRSLKQQYHDLTNRTARSLWVAVMWYGLLGYVRYRLRGNAVPRAHPDLSVWGPAALPENWELHSAFGVDDKNT